MVSYVLSILVTLAPYVALRRTKPRCDCRVLLLGKHHNVFATNTAFPGDGQGSLLTAFLLAGKMEAFFRAITHRGRGMPGQDLSMPV